jgi:two-component system chemotaxis response regulator CheB
LSDFSPEKRDGDCLKLIVSCLTVVRAMCKIEDMAVPKIKKLIVVGTSAGGLDALTRLISPLPKNFPAPIFIVQHMAPDTRGDILVDALQSCGNLPCKHPISGEKIRPGHVYIAPTDHHMLIVKGKIIISKGARENRSRPGIDPLFRSAAVAYRANVIGVLLTGYLDDGTSGLLAIQRCGGTCIVQDPTDAAYPDMPQHAVNNLKPDHCVPLALMPELLIELARKRSQKSPAVPVDVATEAEIAERVVSDLAAAQRLGNPAPFNCPNCGGVLWEIYKGKLLRYRCHTGHAFTSSVLLAEQTMRIEETLWIALRMFEERKNLLNIMAHPNRAAANRAARERAEESQVHIERIRAILLAGEQAITDIIPHGPARSKPRKAKKINRS